jgi:hypothetical protein
MSNAIIGTAINWIIKSINPTNISFLGESNPIRNVESADTAVKKIIREGMLAKGTTCNINNLGIEGFVARSSCQPAVGDLNNLNSVIKFILFFPIKL